MPCSLITFEGVLRIRVSISIKRLLLLVEANLIILWAL
jgi:hypothetical protein